MRTILLVDDEEAIRRIYSNVLEKNGYKVLTAQDVSEAEAIIRDDGIDLLLLDINMQQGDSGALYKRMEEAHKNIKVIVSSVYPTDQQREVIANAYDYFDKSEGLHSLIEKIRRIPPDDEDKNKSILIIDDDLETRVLYHELLTGAGYISIEIGYNWRIFDFLNRQSKNIKLIILDMLEFPLISLDFYQLLRKKFPETRIMVTSTLPVARQKEYIKDAVDYFEKSQGQEVFLEKINALIGPRKSLVN